MEKIEVRFLLTRSRRSLSALFRKPDGSDTLNNFYVDDIYRGLDRLYIQTESSATQLRSFKVYIG